MTKRKNIMNWNVAGNGDAKGREMSAERSRTGI